MTLTTERQQFEEWFTKKYPRSHWGIKKTASGEYQGGLTAQLWEVWQESRGCMANREAQPVQVTDGMALNFHRALTDSDIGKDDLEEIKVGLRAALCNVTAPPAPSGEVVVTRNERGDIVAVTRQDGEGRVIEVIAESNAPPAPAVNSAPDFEAWFVEKYKQPERLVKNEDGTYKFAGVQMAFSAWVDGRAAMLAQPVSSGYKLVPAEATEDMIAAAMNCDDVSFNADETFSVNFGNIYAAMLAATPEGGNG
ncbi:hypothetical protein [Serratia marcescens]|uniref:hypothetical protein n=1 Tax=Serratia marcescens TaxID=615 RepID=UPI00115B753A|nr:hypothetical protein [Serratia marcescens]